jgi:hypothetical protein
MRIAYKVLFRKPERKKPLRGTRYRWENNIRTDFKDSVDWMHMAKDRDQ